MLALDTYQLNLAGLVLACAVILAVTAQRQAGTKSETSRDSPQQNHASQKAFFIVYALIMGSDWLQVEKTVSRAQHHR